MTGMNYQPIENYGLIGNMHTAALVGLNGSVDWLCFPHFDSPSVFCAILDDAKGGRFQISPASGESVIHKQFYWPDTNVLITRFLSPDGVGEVSDFMPVGLSKGDAGYHTLIRSVHVARGSMCFRVECHPAFNYARDRHTISISPEGARFDSPHLSLWLSSSMPLSRQGNMVTGTFTLHPGEMAIFALHDCDRDGEQPPQLLEPQGRALFTHTIEYWRRWLSHCTYTGRWREMVHRSALALKLLTFEPTGAIVAAPTSSLPEGIGGERNWDYRFTWIRDASFILYALLRLGFKDEADDFMNWLEARCGELNPDGSLVLGTAEMAIYDRLDEAWATAALPKLADYGIWVLDANISEAGLQCLLHDTGDRRVILADPVSVAKSARLLPVLGRIHVLFPDHAEAAALSGMPVTDSGEALAAADRICAMGAGKVVVSQGPAGIAVAENGAGALLPAAPADSVRDVTGAGDAFLAGYVYALVHGERRRPEYFGLAAASLTVEVATTVDPGISPDRLRQRAAGLANDGAA